MIIDTINNHKHYRFAKAWEQAFVFLNTLTPESDEGKYEIDGEDIFAIVMSYDTCTPEASIFESHRKYVDIQTVLRGAERFECSFRDDLIVDMPYDESKDLELYKRHHAGQVQVDVFPGTFVMLYPQDAHMAALMIDGKSEYIKKVVVKIKAELLLLGSSL